MGFAVISHHSVNAREANRSSHGKPAGNLFKTTKAIENGVPGIALRGVKVIEWDYRLPFLGRFGRRRPRWRCPLFRVDQKSCFGGGQDRF